MGCGASKPVHVEPPLTFQEQQQRQRQGAVTAAPYSSPPAPHQQQQHQSDRPVPRHPPQQGQDQQQQQQQQQQHEIRNVAQQTQPSRPLTPVASSAMNGGVGRPFPTHQTNGVYAAAPHHPGKLNGTHEAAAATGAAPVPPQTGSSINPTAPADNTVVPVPRPVGRNDPQWQELFRSRRDLLLDPADVHSTLQDLMGRATNRLTEVELLFLQRRVRAAVRQAQTQSEQAKAGRKSRLPFNSKDKDGGGSGIGNASNVGGGSNNNGGGGNNNIGGGGSNIGGVVPIQDFMDAKAVAEKYHLLTRHVLGRVLPRQPSPNVAAAETNGRPLTSSAGSPNSSSNRSLSSLGGNNNNNGGGGGSNSSALLYNSAHGSADGSGNGGGNGDDPIRILDAVYLLAMYCNDSLWDRVADIAVRSAKAAGLEMDVNRQIKVRADDATATATATATAPAAAAASQGVVDPGPNVPEPTPPTTERAPEAPMGVGLQALAFILGLALRGTRVQRLNLLFYVLLPPKTLFDLLERHPAGGFPTWLLEVGQNTIISFASLSHYYWYGGGSTDSPFLPAGGKTGNGTVDIAGGPTAWNGQQQDLALRIPGRHVVNLLLSILTPGPKDGASSPRGGPSSSPIGAVNGNLNGSLHNTNPLNSPPRKASALGFAVKRRSSQANSSNDASFGDDADPPHADITERLQQEHNASASSPDSSFALDDYSDEAGRRRFAEQASQWLKHHPASSSVSSMTIFDFASFVESALDDGCLAAVMHRLFGQGWIFHPSLELDVVQSKWREWQESSDSLAVWSDSVAHPADGALEILSQNVRKVLESEGGNGAGAIGGHKPAAKQRKAFGGLGGFDGRGGIGFGVMYCIEKEWWDTWEAYVGWSWAGDSATLPPPLPSRIRPKELSTESLLSRDDDYIVAGTYGSYELMRRGLEKDVHYVLVPPPVWDVLFEIYGGGPPLPRMVCSPERMDNGGAEASERDIEIRPVQGGNVVSTSRRLTEFDLDAMASTDNADRVLRIPRSLEVETHPWVLHVHLCDPHQPYRKGHNDAGPMTIRVMVSPDQPLWRLYSEIVVRFPFYLYRAYGPDGRGKVRLWKRLDADAPKDPSWRYGPWPCALLCKNRCALLPRQNTERELEEHCDELRENWEAFADHATVESIGLLDGSQMMVEFAVFQKNGEMIWPREAAAKAGRVRRLADTDMKFRNMLRGLDVNGKLLAKSPELVGMVVDAMDASGRWYEVRITQVQTVVADTDEEDEDSDDDAPGHAYDQHKDSGEQKQVRVDFIKHGGHPEWIDVDSDRLATAGRFTLANGDDEAEAPAKPTTGATNTNDAKNKTQAQVKKVVPDSGDSTTKICSIPSYGACGLANLGNTCYINAALQCISYFPLLRAYLLSGEYRTTGDLNKDNPLGTDGKLLEEFVDLLRVMWSAKVGEKSPTRFRGLIAKLNSDFAGANQQDAQELLSYVLDGLMEDSNRVRQKPYVEGLEDDWVKETNLLRVGEEAWRRHLRRSRSIITDIATGQLMSTTTCPVCNFSSRNFDPFNLLSVPLPTVADVMFKIYIVRRANAFNTPWVLNKPKRNGKYKTRFVPRNGSSIPKPPSEQLIVEEYIIAMSRLADSSDLRLKIQSLCGIPAADLRICSAEERFVTKEPDDGTVVRRRIEITLLTDKKGPCSSIARQRTTSEDLGTSPPTPSMIVAFESTLRPRPTDQKAEGADESSEHSVDEEEDEETEGPNKKDDRELARLILKYGNSEECRFYDTDALPISKAISRSIWPTKEEELKLGLRVDAIDHKDHWYPGSVVEILDGDPVNGESKDNDSASKTKVRIHFDNFSSKWDEMYTIDHFIEGRVKPLYSHAAPRTNTTEFVVHHRYTDRTTRVSNLFGQSFYLQCHSEWSTARAGAQILSQAARFLRHGPIQEGPEDVVGAQERGAKVERLYDRTQAVISDLIDLLIECDREYVLGALGVATDTNDGEGGVRRLRNPSFDASVISSSLIKRIHNLLHRLPFEVRVCTIDAPLGSLNEEAAFPFSLMRTIGNYMSARHAIVLQWREPPSDKKVATTSPNGKYSNYLGAPVMYVPPEVVMDEAGAELLNRVNQKAKRTPTAGGSGGLPLGICLTEFCKVQQLSKDDTWSCPRCKDFRPGASQNLVLWRLPDLLTVHMKRFHCSTKWREKITTKVNFPLTGLDMKEWCHQESPVVQSDSQESYVYDLIGVLNHYGGMTGGHYVATCKATPCSKDGREEVAYDFNGRGTAMTIAAEDDSDVQTGWKFGRQKVEVNQNKVAAAGTAKAAGESAEPLWLQFDDEVVEPIPPRHVVSETAYVLFYRRRRLTPANVARYSTLE